MIYILGISAFFHDSAAALVADGIPVACAAEERFTRVKHTSEFPTKAIEYCLETAGIGARNVDYVAFYEKPLRKFSRIIETCIATWPFSAGTWFRAMPLWMTSRLHIAKTIRKSLGLPKTKAILFGEHHLSHAASAFYPSGFDEAVILTVDGVGEWTTTSVGVGRGNVIELDREIRFPHSLGLFYSAITHYLGFQINDAEWKVMGLAAYGEPRFADQLRKTIRTADDGSFQLDMSYFAFHRSLSSAIARKFEKLLGAPRRSEDEPLTDFHSDVARSAQLVVEETLLAIVRDAVKRTGLKKLCIAGGVGLNSKANYRLLAETDVDEIFIQPAAGDDGAALGVALYVQHGALNQPRVYEMRHAYLGPEFSNDEIAHALVAQTSRPPGSADVPSVSYHGQDSRATGFSAPLHFESEDELLNHVSREIDAGKVVGWFQGRMEFGPRALGARSILADPRPAEMKDIINAKVKFRERFRPFAPAVLAEKAHEWFEMDFSSRFMLLVPQVREEKRSAVQAITHADGSARVQTVERDSNPRFYRLIEKFAELTGVPMLLNTSFNVRGEPIVCTPQDAIASYLKSGIDMLVIGDFMLIK
ncbi:MAG: carbamoyltransferase [Planctomycetes bacterium]|nr:carbamoyltransferase [Planctomycetota bacterium]